MHVGGHKHWKNTRIQELTVVVYLQAYPLLLFSCISRTTEGENYRRKKEDD